MKKNNLSTLLFIVNNEIFSYFQEKLSLQKDETLGEHFYTGTIGDKSISIYFYTPLVHIEKNDFTAFGDIFFIGNGKIAKNFDLLAGDICIPNTVIGKTHTLFVEKFIGENYDLTKFGVSLNGISAIADIEDENFYADIIDADIPEFLLELKNTSFIEGVELSEENIDNIFPILEFILT